LSQTGVKFRTFLDAGVPDSVGQVLSAAGHDTIYHRESLPEKTPDTVVAATALANNAILVAIDRDMKQIAQRYGMTPRNTRFERLIPIVMGFDPPNPSFRRRPESTT